MPRKAKEEKPAYEYKPKYIDFSVNERDKILAYLDGREVSWDEVVLGLVDAGVKFALSFSDYHSTFYLTLTPRKDQKQTYSCYIIRHNSLERLAGVLVYFLDHYIDDGAINYQGADDYDW